MKIKSAEFVISNTDFRKCPKTSLPEYAFIGRSNVGKSSLINMLTNRKNLAKTSAKPGKTQLINHFLINKNWYIVDLPGYGWAKVSKELKSKWEDMIQDYLMRRENLSCLFVLIDSRHEPQKIDLEFINWIGHSSIPLSIIFTKGDKQSKSKTMANINIFKKTLKKEWEPLPDMFVSSANTGMGKEEILGYIEMVNNRFNQKG